MNNFLQAKNQDFCEDIIIENLTVTRGKKSIYKNFSFVFEAGTVNAILAPSGAGKTTLLDCIASLIKAESGAVKIGSNNVLDSSKKKKKIEVSYLFQEPRLLPWCSLLQNCTLPLENFMSKEEAHERAVEFLCATGLKDKIEEYPGKLSGGEKQRASVARAFAIKAPVLLMDEAFQSQDIILKEQLMQLLKKLLKTEARTVVCVTHDIREAILLADRIIVLKPTSKTISTLYIALDVLVKNFDNTSLRDKILEIFAV